MKKLALILALIIIPCSAFGLEMLNDSTMDSITGQAGVSIAVDDIQLFLNIEKLAWIDCDGFNSFEGKGTCAGNGGAIVLNNFQMDVININGIVGTRDSATGTVSSTVDNNALDLVSTSCGNIPLFYDYATSAVGDGCALTSVTGLGLQNLGLNNYTHYSGGVRNNYMFVPHFLTIDVTDRLPTSTEGLQTWRTNPWTSGAVAANTQGNDDAASTIGGVLIGIPTVEIHINVMSMTPMYDGDIQGSPSVAVNDDSVISTVKTGGAAANTFGTIYMEGITFTTLGGWIEIAPK